jgi:hypothetical protein
MRAEHKALQDKYDAVVAEKAEQERVANEKAEKKRKADTAHATALFETVSSLWNDQVDDELWSNADSRAEQTEKMKKLIAEKPEMARDLFKIVHCASARYAKTLSSEAQQQREMTAKLGHVLKRRKTVHAASARAAPETPAAPQAAPKEPQRRTLMDIMSGYNGKGGGMSGTATSIMQRLYNEQRKRQSPF